MASDGRASRLIPITVSLWILAVCAGMTMLNRYSTTAGNPGDPSGWPSDSRIHQIAGRPTIVMLAHPRCPCTRASFAELDVLMARLAKPVTLYIVFIRPKSADEEWERTDLWRIASSIPGARVLSDEGGIEATHFRLNTSGHTLLYDTSGRLLFSGGITKSRGHAGDNAGRDAIVSLVNSGASEWSRTPVYGCALRALPIAQTTGGVIQ